MYLQFVFSYIKKVIRDFVIEGPIELIGTTITKSSVKPPIRKSINLLNVVIKKAIKKLLFLAWIHVVKKRVKVVL